MERATLSDTVVELHVPDFRRAKAFYRKLGFRTVWECKPAAHDGYLVLRRRRSILCFYCGNCNVYRHAFFGRFPRTTRRGYGVELSFPVADIDRFYRAVRRAVGATKIVSPLTRKPWGQRDFRLVDPYGFYLRFTEPIDIERK